MLLLHYLRVKTASITWFLKVSGIVFLVYFLFSTTSQVKLMTVDLFVADIKLRLHRELKIPPCRQLLSGWARMKEYNNTPLSQLGLPRENALLLTVKTNEGGFSAEEE